MAEDHHDSARVTLSGLNVRLEHATCTTDTQTGVQLVKAGPWLPRSAEAQARNRSSNYKCTHDMKLQASRGVEKKGNATADERRVRSHCH